MSADTSLLDFADVHSLVNAGLMFSGLHRVEWQQVKHTYGEATDVPALLRAAETGDGDAFEKLVDRVDYYSSGVEAMVPFLVELLEVPALDRVGLLRKLGAILDEQLYWAAENGTPPPAVCEAIAASGPAYARLLTDPTADEDVRVWAAHLLGECVDDFQAVLVRRSGEDPSPLVRAGLIVAIEVTGASTPALVDGWLTDPDPLPRLMAALSASATTATTEEAIQRDLLPSIDALVRLPQVRHDMASARFLSEHLGERWAQRVSLLEFLLTHGDNRTRWSAVFAASLPLMAWRPAAARLAPLMAAELYTGARAAEFWALEGHDFSLAMLGREKAASYLASMGSAAAPFADQLYSLAAGFKREVRSARERDDALTALCRLRDPRVVPYVVDHLSASDEDRGHFSFLLKLLGPWASDCRQALLDYVAKPRDLLRFSAVEALGRVSTPADPDIADVVAALRARLTLPGVSSTITGKVGPEPDTISRLLGDLGPAASAALPDLHALLDHPDPDVGIHAAGAIFRISGDPRPALPLLRARTDVPGSLPPLTLLAELGREGAEFAEPLRARMAEQSVVCATWAAIAFWHVTGDPTPVVPALVRHLENGSLGVNAGDKPTETMLAQPAGYAFLTAVPKGATAARSEAVRCLGAIGPAATAAVPLLRRAATSPLRQVWNGIILKVPEDDAWVRLCTEALTTIDNKA